MPHYVIKFVSVLRQVGGFLLVLRFPPPIKLTWFKHMILSKRKCYYNTQQQQYDIKNKTTNLGNIKSGQQHILLKARTRSGVPNWWDSLVLLLAQSVTFPLIFDAYVSIYKEQKPTIFLRFWCCKLFYFFIVLFPKILTHPFNYIYLFCPIITYILLVSK